MHALHGLGPVRQLVVDDEFFGVEEGPEETFGTGEGRIGLGEVLGATVDFGLGGEPGEGPEVGLADEGLVVDFQILGR